jgi:hypothetical protein
LDFLMKYPESSPDVAMYIEQMVLKLNADAQADGDRFCEKYNRIWRIPPAWWHAWLATNDKRMTKTVLDLIHNHNPQALRYVGYFVTGLCGNDVLPKELLCKAVASRVFAILSSERGDRIGRVLAHTNKDTGEIDWSKCGPYHIVFDQNGVATSITHETGVTVPVSRSSSFYNDWKVEEPYADHAACVKGPMKASYPLAGFFPLGQGLPGESLPSRTQGGPHIGRPWSLRAGLRITDQQKFPSSARERN